MDIFGFENLSAYQRAMNLVAEVYQLMKSFPSEERYALCDQLRRAVVSVPSNLAEGLSRYSDKEKSHFVEIAYGSLMETYCQLGIAKKLNYISEEDYSNIVKSIEETARILSGLRKSFMKV